MDGFSRESDIQGAKLAKTVFYVTGEERKCPYSLRYGLVSSSGMICIMTWEALYSKTLMG